MKVPVIPFEFIKSPFLGAENSINHIIGKLVLSITISQLSITWSLIKLNWPCCLGRRGGITLTTVRVASTSHEHL